MARPTSRWSSSKGSRSASGWPAARCRSRRSCGYGQQLAGALAHAHARGVVHRDFKSANVVVTPEGQVKVLDFGLAKRLAGEEIADAATVSRQSLTETGVVAGTLAYMAPEQLRGRPADARSDIWALGIVLYELATGKRPFEGKTGFELSSAILSQPVPSVPPSVPAPLAGVIDRCLAKEPGDRYQRGGEVQAALEAAASGQARGGVAGVACGAEASPGAGGLGGGAFALVVDRGGARWLRRRRRAGAPHGRSRGARARHPAGGAAVREPHRRRGAGVSERRPHDGDDRPARAAAPRVAQRDRAHVGDALQEDEHAHRSDWPRAGRGVRPRRERAARGGADPDYGRTDQGGGSDAAVGGELRARHGGHPRAAKRRRAEGGRRAGAEAAARRAGPPRQRARGGSRGLRGVPEGLHHLYKLDARRPGHRAEVFRVRAAERPGLCARAT